MEWWRGGELDCWSVNSFEQWGQGIDWPSRLGGKGDVAAAGRACQLEEWSAGVVGRWVDGSMDCWIDGWMDLWIFG